ncbi:Coenzyme F420 hydrogenase/dehydrogenase, beta subunit C-terminal domain [Prevotella sp. P4-119]|uniref:Coenzyme F420 hydrogenase/dehydrogenase, beta subunit C-terminal domain n=1 Tax=Prevotella sp. P4-119 TaxID=2024218 RepID=UPI000B974280|nr:Coenzyme F420 hydrogenase/dehydrogenase, beta subunit C-terminal domain [Prevotella sp. P4-119]OYP43761.1 4Fe-4S ferredoxin [Prevotella sp. P4-119]
MDKSNISNIHDCYGCGVCATVCAKQIISIELNGDGFYEPRMTDESKCTSCGLCLDVCAYSHDELSLKDRCIKSYGAWSKDEAVRRKCSSGGVGFELGRTLIGEGYKVCGVRYNAEANRAEHYIATTVEELIPSIGSKYIQSYTVDGFKAIDRKQKYLVTGTPCQIDSFRRMIRKFKCEDNFVLLDFFCHSVPSMLAWRAYIKMLEPKIGKVTYASWRNKFEYGWHDSWLMGMDGVKTSSPINWHDSYNMLIRGKKTFIQSRWSKGDWFYRMFLGDYCSGKHCQERCKYKYDKSSADIRIGDLWGKTYQNNQKGVSGLVAFTEKGREIIESLLNVTLLEHPFEVVAEGQMKRNAKPAIIKPIIMFVLRNHMYLSQNGWNILFNVLDYPIQIAIKFRSFILKNSKK